MLISTLTVKADVIMPILPDVFFISCSRRIFFFDFERTK